MWTATRGGRRMKGWFDFGLRIASTWWKRSLTTDTPPRLAGSVLRYNELAVESRFRFLGLQQGLCPFFHAQTP